ncbi:MAG: reverse transcriptase-like protein [Verrucomicrobiae bacterium]|nr:reverse transcriptase-like protein [Verrucomicrobiae bacterium]
MMIGRDIMKYYAVKEGHITGVFDNWQECQKATSGYPNADFKSFRTQEEAEAYIENRDISLEEIKKDIEGGYVVAFCDGSYDERRDRYSYGVLAIDHDLNEEEICNSAKNTKYLQSKNIVGEVLGAINAMDWAVSHNYSKLKIYHDYEGICKWISGEWEAKKPVSQMYVSLYKDKYADLLEVAFEKVKGHSNNRYNDKADELAKRALSKNARIPIGGENWYTVPFFEKDELQKALNLLSEEASEIVLDSKNEDNRSIHKLRFGNDRLTITLFKTGKRTLLVQGQPSLLFQMVTTYINELVGVKEEIFQNAYRKNIEKDKINNAFKAIFPDFPSGYPEGIKRLIRQSIINLHYFVESEDYSQYVFPALRALEGHMKYLFKKEGMIITKNFGHFEKNHELNKYHLPSKIISNTTARERLEKCYNFFQDLRHSLFHFGDIIGDTDATRFIETKEEADERIKECLSYIAE